MPSLAMLFQTVDTDFSPGDGPIARLAWNRLEEFQTVDTDFSPGDNRLCGADWFRCI